MGSADLAESLHTALCLENNIFCFTKTLGTSGIEVFEKI